ncbi:nuclear transport factor 2 family protein [Pseudoalteromonas sp. L1]|uniref:nuclear transport factor 2 family protein n=1 Tax=unclassified Pseudoalteromonas TaxID=194690 RepID=UPI001F42476C|nr:nuclear transport factor 2 family protein [Pseudoalteromonas sp. L1]
MDKVTLDRFIEIYQSLNKNNVQLLDDIYHPDIQFTDPLHTVNGLESLHHYFENLYANVLSCQFSIKDTESSNNKAFIYWTMHYRHPKLNNGNSIAVEGHSRLVFEGDKIVNHQDYFDVGALLYRHIPLLGTAIRYIDKRTSA